MAQYLSNAACASALALVDDSVGLVAVVAKDDVLGREPDDGSPAGGLDEPEQPIAAIATLAIANACSSGRIRAPQIQRAALPEPLREHTICPFREVCF
jgi:hypothetical protein